MRGDFDFFTDKKSYTNSEKDWIVELIHSNCYWYDLIVNPPKFAATNKYIINSLKALKKEIESQLEKRFIYFIASRKKIRFSIKKQPKYSFFDNSLIIWLEIGKNKKLKRKKVKIYSPVTGTVIKPEILISDRFITLLFDKDHSHTYPVHDFLRRHEINLSIATEIHYVGITETPEKRPFNGSHAGLSSMLATVSNEENDCFIFVNLFKVLVMAKNKQLGINFCLSNAMIYP